MPDKMTKNPEERHGNKSALDELLCPICRGTGKGYLFQFRCMGGVHRIESDICIGCEGDGLKETCMKNKEKFLDWARA